MQENIPDELRVACHMVSVRWTLSGEQILRLFREVEAQREELKKLQST